MNTDAMSLLTVSEAAAVAGVSVATVRSWLHRYPDRLRTDRTVTGMILIAEADLLEVEHSTRTTGRGRPRRFAAT